MGQKIDPQKDKVEWNGKWIKNSEKKKIYILLNKPIGYVTTVSDQFKRDTVMDLIKGIGERVVPVGRLDMYTSGALILSNDGEFIHYITHPSHEITKTYQVTLKGCIQENDIKKLQEGVDIGGYITKPAEVKILKIDQEKKISRISIVIHEGKNRQVRKMCEAIQKIVIALHRSKIGNIEVKPLRIGEYRYLTEKEVQSLKKAAK